MSACAYWYYVNVVRGYAKQPWFSPFLRGGEQSKKTTTLSNMDASETLTNSALVKHEPRNAMYVALKSQPSLPLPGGAAHSGLNCKPPSSF